MTQTTKNQSFALRHKTLTIVSCIVLLVLAALIGRSWYQDYQFNQFQKSLNSFYTPPNPLTPGRPGDVIRSEPLGTNPQGGVGYRILYRTQLADGTPAVSSG